MANGYRRSAGTGQVWTGRPGRWLGFLLLLIAPVSGLQVYGQDVTYDHSSEWFGIRVGYLELDNIEDKGSLNLGITSGIRFNDPLGLELSVDYHTSEFSDMDRTTYALQLSLLLFLTPADRQVQPYLVGGGGYYLSGYDYWVNGTRRTDFTTHEFGGHVGAGIDIWLSPAASLTVDVRYLFVQEDAPGVSEVDGVLATVGSKFRF